LQKGGVGRLRGWKRGGGRVVVEGWCALVLLEGTCWTRPGGMFLFQQGCFAIVLLEGCRWEGCVWPDLQRYTTFLSQTITSRSRRKIFQSSMSPQFILNASVLQICRNKIQAEKKNTTSSEEEKNANKHEETDNRPRLTKESKESTGPGRQHERKGKDGKGRKVSRVRRNVEVGDPGPLPTFFFDAWDP
jgi:hypothetical protein